MASQKGAGAGVDCEEQNQGSTLASGGLWWVHWHSFFRGEHTTTLEHLMADTKRTACGREFPWALTSPKFVPLNGPFCTRCLKLALAAS